MTIVILNLVHFVGVKVVVRVVENIEIVDFKDKNIVKEKNINF